MSRGPYAKHWVFTVNNYTDEECTRLRALHSECTSRRVTYLVFGREQGASGTPHLQGYIRLDRKCRLSWLKKEISSRGHFEVSRGSPLQAASYCKKDGDFEEFGELPGGRGARTELDALAGMLADGASLGEIRKTFPGLYIKHRRAIRDEIRERVLPRDSAPTVKVLWGPTGTGKTRSVYDYHIAESIYKHDGGDWFDGYTGQDVVLFDDFSGSDFKLTYLLKLCDRYPMRVPVKGDFVHFNPKVIYFTSNVDPEEWYKNAIPEHRAAFFRRVSEIVHMDHSS
jgi:Putative viral replication protein/RNA helicase